MKFKELESYIYKDKYLCKKCKWDWINHDMIHVYDNKSGRLITMDYWPQEIYLGANGQTTVSELVHFIASNYPSKQIPRNLDAAIIEELQVLLNEELIVLSDSPIQLDDSLLYPLTEEGVVDVLGTWKGFYTYDIPDEFKDHKTQKVEFEIEISSVHENQFRGSVRDNISTGGTPGIGYVVGAFDNWQMTFEKNMPIHARIEKDGSHSLFKDKKHPAILYNGVFSRNKKVVNGIWRFKKKVLIWRGIIPLLIIPGTGTFSMEKVENTR